MAQSIEEWYKQMPVITRSYLTLSFLTTAGCALEVISPFSVYFNARLIFHKLQLWRLFTNFFFFGSLGLDFLFHMFFLARYCRLLEEGSFRGRTADFFFMLVFGGVMLTCFAPFVNIQFLGSSLTFMMVYVWGRRHQYVNMSFLGLFNFTAPYLPWVLLAFSVMLGSSPVVDLLGMVVGHAYYFLEDVYPRMTGRRLLKTPGLVRALFPRDDEVQHAMPAPGVVDRDFGGVVGGGAGGGRGRRGRAMGQGAGRTLTTSNEFRLGIPGFFLAAAVDVSVSCLSTTNFESPCLPPLWGPPPFWEHPSSVPTCEMNCRHGHGTAPWRAGPRIRRRERGADAPTTGRRPPPLTRPAHGEGGGEDTRLDK